MVIGTKKVPFVLGQDMIDLRNPGHVEIEVTGDRLYIHVEGVTVLRIYGVSKLDINDNGNQTETKES